MLKYIHKTGPLAFHAPGGATVKGGRVIMSVYSWATLDGFVQQQQPSSAIQVEFDPPFDLERPEEALATHPQSPLLGGTVYTVLPHGVTLADLKATKNDAINRARAAANSSHFTFQGKQIAVDPLSRSDIDATHGAVLMLQALPPGWPGGWKAMDNTMVPIADLNTWGAFYAAMVAQGTANFNHAQTLKAQLAAASTPAEVEAVPSW